MLVPITHSTLCGGSSFGKRDKYGNFTNLILPATDKERKQQTSFSTAGILEHIILTNL